MLLRCGLISDIFPFCQGCLKLCFLVKYLVLSISMNQVEIVFNNQKIKGIWRDVADESVWAEIFKWREYRIAEEIIKTPSAVIFDIGAHAGFFALYCLALNESAKIWGVEPETNNLQMIKENFALNKNLSSIEVVPSALTVVDGECLLKISPDNHNHHVLTNNDSDDDTVKVKGISLASLLKKSKCKKVDLVKMDIEGGEWELFESWDENNFGAVANFVFEYHEDADHRKEDLVQVLREQGFGVQIFLSKFDHTMGIIFANNKRLK